MVTVLVNIGERAIGSLFYNLKPVETHVSSTLEEVEKTK